MAVVLTPANRIDRNGNLTVHIEESLREPVQFTYGPDLADASAIPLFFESGTVRRALLADTDTSIRLISLSNADIRAIAAAGRTPRYAVFNEANGEKRLLWDGRVLIRGVDVD